MEYRHLRFFLMVADELHFTRAAKRLNVAQPHLSQEIRRLEADVGASLFFRTRRHVELTEAGRVFRERALGILHATEEARHAAQRAGEGATGSLSVGFAGSAGYDILPQAIRRFRSRWPDVELALHEINSARQIIALRDNQIDVGLMRRSVHDERDISSITVRREKLEIAFPRGHARAAQKTIALGDLATEPWIVFDRSPNAGLFTDFQAACTTAGFQPVVAQEAGELPTMINLVASGLGVAMVPESVTRLRRSGVVYRPLKPQPKPSLLVMAWRESSQSVTLRNFRRVVKELSV